MARPLPRRVASHIGRPRLERAAGASRGSAAKERFEAQTNTFQTGESIMSTKRITTIFTALVVVFLFILSAAPAARGAASVRFKVGHSDKCLDVSAHSKADGAKIQQWACHAMSNRKWIPVVAGQLNNMPTFLFKSVNSGKCLDVHRASKENGAKIH